MKKVLVAIAVVLVIAAGAYWILSGRNSSTSDQVLTNTNSDQTSGTDRQTEPSNQQEQKTFSTAEVSNHNQSIDCWTIIRGTVYDLTSFIARHPGGDEILRACGTDATTLFESRTSESGETIGSGTPPSASAQSQLESLKIGTLR